MTGRYGADQLSLALLVMAVVLSITVRLIGIPYLSLIVYIPLGLCIFRMLSKNIKRRSMENYKFYMLTSRVRRWFGKIQRRMAESKTHRFFKCPDCKAELRLPKGKGKIVITCPKCRHEFMRKT
jgi:DNA-directed RNA polymerase subunit RPC12/RpoP